MDCPVQMLLLSAKSSTEDEMLGYKAGADFYIKKPFEPDVLIKQLTNPDLYNFRYLTFGVEVYCNVG
jgi:Response regulators consisting of a CheY-like receiver domain and a winged-helix DNA-binding domain